MTTEAAAPAAPQPSPVELLYPAETSAAAPPADAPSSAAPPEPVSEGTVADEAPSAVPTLAEGAEGDPAGAEAEGEAPQPEPEALTIEAYTSLKVPEGLTVDEGLLAKFKETSLAGKVSPEAAQGLLNLYHEALQTAAASASSAATAQMAEWKAQASALPELQGETGRISRQALGRAFDEYGTPELGQFLAESGVGNNPHLVKYILRLASALDEGSPTPAGAPANPSPNGRPTGPRTAGQILYSSDGPGSIPTQQ